MRAQSPRRLLERLPGRALAAVGLLVAGLLLAWFVLARPDLPRAGDLSTVRERLIASELDSLELVDSTLTVRGRDGYTLRVESVTVQDWQQLASLAMHVAPVPSMSANVVTGDRLSYRLGLVASYAAPVGLGALLLMAALLILRPAYRGWRKGD